jgi:hypothetical protein
MNRFSTGCGKLTSFLYEYILPFLYEYIHIKKEVSLPHPVQWCYITVSGLLFNTIRSCHLMFLFLILLTLTINKRYDK